MEYALPGGRGQTPSHGSHLPVLREHCRVTPDDRWMSVQ